MPISHSKAGDLFFETLTWREQEILSLLAKRRTNKEIAQDLGIELTTVKWYNKQIFNKLMVNSRYQAVAKAKEYGLLETPATSVSVPVNRPKTSLPIQLTSFIGRQQDLERVNTLLEDSHLLTLTGPGGVGKTRLAIRAAQGLENRFPDGRYFVDLSPINESEKVADSIAETLGVRKSSQTSLADTLMAYLSNKDLLLILDNFEHLMGASILVGDLIQAAPAVRIMVTSREILRLYGEQEYHVRPLAIPDLKERLSSQELIKGESVALFCERVRAFDPGFMPTDEEIFVISEICSQLDGLPLAIELAASRVKMYSLGTLLVQLTGHFTALSNRSRDISTRHQTLQSTLEWSYGLLDEEEKKVFNRLSVFTGGFDLQAAQEVTKISLSRSIVEIVESLLIKNLLTKNLQMGGKSEETKIRFMMLNTIHGFASERLKESGETQEILKRHADWFASLIGDANPDLSGDELIGWLNQITSEYKNIEKVLKWAFGGNDIQTGLKMVSALGHFWRNKYRLAEGQEWLLTALEFADQASIQDLGNIYEAAGYITQNLGNIAAGRTYWENALEIQRNLGNKSRIAGLLISLSHPTLGLEGISIDKTLEGIELARQIGDKRQIAHGLNVLGEIYRLQNDYDSAKQVYEECLDVAREANDRIREVLNIANLGLVAFNQGEYKLARGYGLKAYKLALDINNDYIIAEGLTSNGGFLAGMGQLERGTQLMGAGDKQLAEIGAKSQFTDQIEFNKMEQLIRHQVDDETYDRWYAEGQKLTLYEAIKLVLQEE